MLRATQEVEAPAQRLTEEQIEVAQFYEKMAPASQPEPELTEEFASVENTTLLIADLEKQLETRTRDLERLSGQYADLLAHVRAGIEQKKSLWTKFKEQWVREREAAREEEKRMGYYGL